MMTQFWIGSTDVTFLLTQIGGWHVGCQNEREAREAVDYVKKRGWVRERTHYAPAIPEGCPAYELTDAGLEWIRLTSGEKAMQAAGKARDWYRASANKYRPALPTSGRDG